MILACIEVFSLARTSSSYIRLSKPGLSAKLATVILVLYRNWLADPIFNPQRACTARVMAIGFNISPLERFLVSQSVPHTRRAAKVTLCGFL